MLTIAIYGREKTQKDSLFMLIEQALSTDRVREIAEVNVVIAHGESDGTALIAAERARQIRVECWTPDHDDEHTDHSLALAACAYAAPSPDIAQICWPASWSPEWDKRPVVQAASLPGVHPVTRLAGADEIPIPQRIRNLAKAGALIAAEIDRLQRLCAEMQ